MGAVLEPRETKQNRPCRFVDRILLNCSTMSSTGCVCVASGSSQLTMTSVVSVTELNHSSGEIRTHLYSNVRIFPCLFLTFSRRLYLYLICSVDMVHILYLRFDDSYFYYDTFDRLNIHLELET